MGSVGNREPQACPTCGRAWDHRAAFCGACGDRLAGSLLGPRRTDDDRPGRTTPPWWRRPALGWAALAVLVVAAVVAVPVVTIEQTDPVTGEIGVPEDDQLRPVTGDEANAPPPDPPSLTCRRDGDLVDCIEWMRPVGPGVLSGPPVLVTSAPGHVVALQPARDEDGDARTVVLDATTGRRLWERPGSGTTPQVRDDAVVLHAMGRVAMVSIETGDERWAAPVADQTFSTLGDELVYTQPIPSGPTSPHTVVARSVDDGETAWSWTPDGLPAGAALLPTPLAGGRVMFRSFRGHTTVLDTRTGQPVWATERPDPAWSTVVGSTLLTLRSPSSGAVVTAIDVGDGTVRWEREGPWEAAPIGIVDDLVVVPSADQLSALDRETGEVVWRQPTRDHEQPAGPATRSVRGRAPPRPADLVVTVSAAGVARGRDVATGEGVWERDLDVDSHSGAEVAGDHVLVQHGRGVAYLDLATGRRLVDVLGTRLQPALPDHVTVLSVPTTGHVLRVDPTTEVTDTATPPGEGARRR